MGFDLRRVHKREKDGYYVNMTPKKKARKAIKAKIREIIVHGGALTEPLPFIALPTGVARYPREVLRWPRSWVERQYNVTHWADMPRGGHFAAMEQPELFVGDLREFFRTVRGA